MNHHARRFQYAVSDDPDVIAAVTRNENARREAFTRIIDEVTRWGASTFVNGGSPGGLAIAGIILDEKPAGPAGRWAWVDSREHGRGVRPAKSNPVSDVWAGLSWTPDLVPGVPLPYEAEADGEEPGTVMYLTYSSFIHARRAWALVRPCPTRGAGFGRQWEEALTSEALAARRGYAAARRVVLR